MLSEFEKRAAELAVSLYGANRKDVKKIVDLVVTAHAQGHSLDLLDAFEQHRLLTGGQARDMRLALDNTHVDLHPPKSNGANGNGKSHGDAHAGDINGASTLPPTPQLAGEADEGNIPKVLGEFHILRCLGVGGMGTVFLGYHESQKRHVAIKVLSWQNAGSQIAVDRFYREAKSGALLNHPNIVRNIAVGQDKATGLHYMVMEYVDGPSAGALLEKNGRLTVGDALHIVLDIARGLEHAHSRNVVHRDIKPANILLTQSGLAKLADLGLAKRTDEASHLTAARQGFGTPYYMPYEQAINARQADARCDIYALGATLYHLVAGEVPFNGPSHVEIVEKKKIGEYVPATVLNPELPKSLDVILARMMAPEPRQRYQTASELIVELERTRLAAPVPSFVDPDRALRDPVVRQRLNVPMAVTAPDLSHPKQKLRTPLWYLRHRDTSGRWVRAKLTVPQVIKRVKEGWYAPPVEVSPQPNGVYRPLQAYAEFQELAVLQAAATASAEAASEQPETNNEALRSSAPSHKPFWYALAGVAALVLIVCWTLYFVFEI